MGRKVKKCQSPIILNAADNVKGNDVHQQNEKVLISVEEDFINTNEKDVEGQTHKCFEVDKSYNRMESQITKLKMFLRLKTAKLSVQPKMNANFGLGAKQTF